MSNAAAGTNVSGAAPLPAQHMGAGNFFGLHAAQNPAPAAGARFQPHDELALLGEFGLTPLAALQAATLRPAEFLGRSNKLCSITAQASR